MIKNKKDVLNQIKKDGFICSGMLPDELHTYLQLQKTKGKLETLEDLGIKFINESYFYILKGNPDKVHVTNKGNISYLTK